MVATLVSCSSADRRVAGSPEVAPAVTFIVAAFNVAPFIEEAISSALAQKDVVVEVIVVDDASSDETPDIVEKLAASEPRISLIRQPKNLGPGAARNVALRHAKGKWIAILDGDDLLAPNRTTEMLKRAEATGADIVGDNFERITMDGKPTGNHLFPTAGVPYLFAVDAAAFIDANHVLGRKRFSLGAIKVMVRSEFVSRHAIYHPEDLPVGEDFQFILSCLFAGARFIVTSTPGYKYRLRSGSQSWRLTDQHMEKLHVAQSLLLREAERAGCARAQAAAIDYGHSLDRTANFVHVVSLASGGAWKDALLWAAKHPKSWPLIIRFGSQAVRKRLFAPLRPRERMAL